MEELRQKAIDALRRHKSGWIKLGAALAEINASCKWKDWGYEKFQDYHREELGLTPLVAREMMLAYEYIKHNEPNVLNTLDSGGYVPDFHTIASLSKASTKEKISDDKEDEIRDVLFNATPDSAAVVNKKVMDLLAEANKKDGEEILNDIKRKTTSIKKRIKKINNEIQTTSSFNNEILELSEKLTGLILKVEV